MKYIGGKWRESGFKRYLKSASWSMSSRLFSMVISFVATTYIARSLGPTNFGQLSYALSFVSIFSFIASLGIDGILYRELIKTPEKRNQLLGSALFIKLCAGSIAGITCIISALFFTTDDVSMILIFILTGTFIFNSFQIINHEFQARLDAKYPAIINVSVVIILNILKIFSIITGKGVIYLSLILLLESILYALFYFLAYEIKLKEKVSAWKIKTETVISLLKDSWPLIFSTAFILIYSRIDQIFIKHIIDAKAVGVYDSAVRIAEVWYIIPNVLVTALFPAIISAKKISEDTYNNRLGKFVLLLLALSLIISIPISIFAPLIIKILYGSDFLSGVIVLQIYIWASMGVFLGTLVTNYLIAENYKKILFFTSLLPMLVNVLLNITWIPEYGITGAAYATLISYMLLPLSILFFRQTRTRVIQIFKLMI